MKVEIKKIGEHIYHLEFNKQSKLTMTFLRFQEYFESPKFRGKIFTLKKFRKWYKKTNHGQFSYEKDWVGFNIPSDILRPFYEGKFDPLSEKEKWMLDQFKNIAGKFYIIGTFKSKGKKKKKENLDTLKHEMAYALFFTNEEYKAEVRRILEPLNLKKFKKALVKDGDYHESVLEDECHAYILGNQKWLKSTWEIKVGPFKKAHKKLKKVFDKYAA